MLLELCWSKQRILEVYLNIAETGKRTFGMQAASLKYFSRPASAVSREQAALLAAVLPNPVRFKAASPQRMSSSAAMRYSCRCSSWVVPPI